MCKINTILLLLFMQFSLTAQNTELDLVRVEFWQPQDQIEHWIRIKKDGSNGIEISEGPKTKVWMLNTDGSVTKKPAAYVSGSTPRIGACFKKGGENISCAGSDGIPSNNSDFFARATIEGIDQSGAIVFLSSLPIRPLVKIGTGSTYEYIATEINDKLEPETIQFFESFKIKWEWSKTNEELGDWFEAGISENIVYVTLNKPIKENPGIGYSHYLTLIHIGCKYGDKATSDADLVAQVWSYFEGRQVCRVDGEPLKYYGQWSSGNLSTTTKELLTSKNGMCSSWAKTLLDVLKLQGFQELNNLVRVRGYLGDVISDEEGFLVRNWQESPPGTSGEINFPFKNIKNTPFYTSMNTYDFAYQEVYCTASLSAQNNGNCVSDFTNHVFVRILGDFYDPSYGTRYGNTTTVEIPDPQLPGENLLVETIPDFNNNAISAFYYIKPSDINLQLIQMKTTTSPSFVYLEIPAQPELDDY